MPRLFALLIIIGSTLLHAWNLAERSPWAEIEHRPALASQPAQPHVAVNPYSVNTFLSNEVEPWKRKKTMEMIERAHIGWIKQQFLWSEIEPAQGSHWDEKFQQDAWKKHDEIVALAEEHGVRIIARLDHTPAWARVEGSDPHTPPLHVEDYGNFVATFVERYDGRVQYLQIWNEPNLSREWGGEIDPDAYFLLLREAYVRAKEVNPNIVILSAPMAMTNERSGRAITEYDFWERLFELGAHDYFDVMTATGYGLNDPPETPPDDDVINLRRVERLRDLADAAGASEKPIWLTEFGWNASPETIPEELLAWGRVTEEEQADWTSRGIEWMDESWPWFGVASIWYFRQIGDIPPQAPRFYFRMVDHEFSPRPVYQSVQRTAGARSIALAGRYGPLEAPLRPYGTWARADDPSSPFGEYIWSDQPGAELVLRFSGTDVQFELPPVAHTGVIYLELDGAPVSGNHVQRDDRGRSYIDLATIDGSSNRLTLVAGHGSDRPQQPHTLTVQLADGTVMGVAAVDIGYDRSYTQFGLFALLGLIGYAASLVILRR